MVEDTRVRDELARDRTALANERTALAYGRTALALLGIAILIFKFADTLIALTVGPLFLTIMLFVALLGVRSYRNIDSKIQQKEEQSLAFAEVD